MALHKYPPTSETKPFDIGSHSVCLYDASHMVSKYNCESLHQYFLQFSNLGHHVDVLLLLNVQEGVGDVSDANIISNAKVCG